MMEHHHKDDHTASTMTLTTPATTTITEKARIKPWRRSFFSLYMGSKSMSWWLMLLLVLLLSPLSSSTANTNTIGNGNAVAMTYALPLGDSSNRENIYRITQQNVDDDSVQQQQHLLLLPPPPQLNGQHFRITVLEEGTFLTVANNDQRNTSWKVGGYLYDMIQALAHPSRANFTYTLLPPSGHGRDCSPRIDDDDDVGDDAAASGNNMTITHQTYSSIYRTQYNCGSGDVNDLPHSSFTTDMYLGLYYVTPSRQLQNQFTIPYSPPYRGTLAMYGTATGINSFEELVRLQQQGPQPLPACAPGGTALIDFIRQAFPGIQLIGILGGDDDSIDSAFDDGTCQVYITDAPLVTQFVLKRSRDPNPDRCYYNGKPIGLIGEPMKFGLSHYAIGIRRDIPIQVERTLSYWINVLMSCNSLDPNGQCPDGNLADYYATQGGTGTECGYVANPVSSAADGLAISTLAIVAIVILAVAMALCIYRYFHQWQLRRQKERITMLETYQKRLRLLDKVAEVQREYLESNNSQIVFQTLLEGIVELMESTYGVIGQVKYDNDTDNPYLHIDASVHNRRRDDSTIDHRRQYNATALTVDADSPNKLLLNYPQGPRNHDTPDAAVGRWRDPLSLVLIDHVLTTKRPVLRNEVDMAASVRNAITESIRTAAWDKKEDFNDDVEQGTNSSFRSKLPPLQNFLGIPFFAKGGQEISGMIAIANKKDGYTDDDVQFLEPLSATVTNLVQAFWQIARNEHLIDTLENTVKERTHKLQLANRELEEANQRVLQASAAQLTHFASMSHEIRTPLNCIIGLSSMLLETQLTPNQEEEIRMIVTSGDLLLTVVNDILDYSKLESGNVEINVKECNLQDVMNAVVHSIESKSVDKKLSVRKSYDTALPECVRMDGLRVQQIMYNLLGNAVKFSKEGGTIDFSIALLSSAEIESSKEANDADRLPDQIRFRIKDYGSGIAKKNFDKIFQPFSQADKETQTIYGGTGLGLAISSKLANALGGSITVDSVLGEWTSFSVDLPFDDKPVDVAAISMVLQNTHIYFVVKDERVADHVRNILEAFRASFSVHADLADGEAIMGRENVLMFNAHVCLVDETLYDTEAFEGMKSRVPCHLLTFGPSLSVTDTEGHFRYITHVFPSVLAAKLALPNEQPKNPRASSRFSVSRQSFSSCVTTGTNESGNDSELTSSARYSLRHSTESITPSLSPLRVMVAEDNLINQKVLVRLLKRIDVDDVSVVDDGEKAVELEAAEEFDVIFMDYQMPKMDGVEACRRITRRLEGNHPPAKVVFVTANASTVFETECYEAGGVDFLPKPFNVREIEALLESLFS